MGDATLLHISNRDGIVWFTMDHAPANALCNALLRELVSALEDAVEDNAVRGVVLRGAGEKFFTAGGDVREFSTLDEEGRKERVDLGSRLKVALSRLECPYLCAVNGAAIGSGMEMAALADHCLASSTARFGMPEINHGLLPMAKGIQQLVKVIGLNNTKSVLFEGEIFDADRALEIGLVHRIVAPEELDREAEAWIGSVGSKPLTLFRALKRTINQCLDLTDDELAEMTQRDLSAYQADERIKADRDEFLSRKSAEPAA